jgi:hypothetical protein
MYIQYEYIQVLFQSWLGTADYALVFSSLHYNLNYWVMHPVARVSINISRNLLLTEVSIYIDLHYNDSLDT